MAIGSVIKQPHEEYFIAVDFTGRLPAGVVPASGSVYAAEIGSDSSTTFDSSAIAGATTISLVADPGIGSHMVLGTGTVEENAKAKTVTGSGPYTVGLEQVLQFAHGDGDSVSYLKGKNTLVLDQLGATISGNVASRQIKGGQPGITYKVSFVITLDDGSKFEDDLEVTVDEL